MKGQKMIYSIRQMTRYLMLAITFVVALHALPLEATAQTEPEDSSLRLYDNFSSPNLDPARWFVGYACSDPTTLECVRQIENGHLHMRVRAYGDRNSNAGTEYGHDELFLSDAAVTDIAADVTILHDTMSPCVTSPGAGTHGDEELYGRWFNDGSGISSGDTTAFVGISRTSDEPANELGAGAFLQYQGASLNWISLGPVNMGERVRLELKWDKSHHRFLAYLTHLANNSTVEVVVPYTLSDTVPAVFPGKALSVSAFPENCTGVPTYVDVEAEFDRVLAN
jgi:hypothetical protein